MSDRVWRTLSGPVESWSAALRAMTERDARTVVADLLDAWIEGSVYSILDPGSLSPRSLDRRLATVFATLRDLEPDALIRWESFDESSVRRWCWIERWMLSEQDEDLLLMDEPFWPWLLDEAGAGCPKADYAASIVAHSVRHAAHGWLARGFRSHAHQAVGLLPLARAARAHELVSYLERLERYALPGKVDEDEARSRASDLAGCRAPEQVAIQRRGNLWIARSSDLVIDAQTGEMWRENK